MVRAMHHAWHFTRHYLEMVIAMLLGMFVLGGALLLTLPLVGIDAASWDTEAPALSLLGMGVVMTVPMLGWMRYRGHGRTALTDMTAAMAIPTLGAVALLTVVDDFHALMMLEHVAMFGLMFVAMLARPGEYLHVTPGGRGRPLRSS